MDRVWSSKTRREAIVSIIVAVVKDGVMAEVGETDERGGSNLCVIGIVALRR